MMATRLPLLIGLLLLAAYPWVVPNFYVTLGSTALVWGMFALSLQLLVGVTGLVSLGHGAFFGLAAYALYFVTPDSGGLSILLTLPLAALVAGLAALAIGALALRTRSFFVLMVTLAFAQMVFFLFHDTDIGGGADGVFVPRPVLGVEGFAIETTKKTRGLVGYYVNLALLAAMYLALAWLLRSLFGRVLTGIRINEHRMRALGFDTYRYKLLAFVIAGALAGIAGHQWVMNDGFVNPELVGWHRSAEALLMILVGGLGFLYGPVLGALAFTAVGEISQLITERQLLVQGLFILAIVLVLPQGLAGIRLPRRRRETVSDGQAATEPGQ